MTTEDTRQPAPALDVLRKVPQATALFWTIKILTTGMGETAADFFDHHLDPVLVVGATGLALVVSLVLQFRARGYVPPIYWFAVVMVSVFGTLVADGVRQALGISYLTSTIGLLVVLVAVLGGWYLTEGTLSIHSITGPRREAFYWATVMTTFALGTAAGDLTAQTFDLGYLTSGVLFIGVIALPAFARAAFRLNAVLAFWTAYIITRPLGASFADWMAVPHTAGGLQLGTGPVTLVLTVVIVALVGVAAVRSRRAT